MSTDLRSSLIRLAHAQPALRPHLLPLLREASSEILVSVEGRRGPSYTGDRDAVVRALLEQGVPRDRVTFLIGPFKDKVSLSGAEVNKLLRARVIVPAPGPGSTLAPALNARDAEKKYRALLSEAAREMREAAENYSEEELEGAVWDLAEGIYSMRAREFEPLLPLLDLRKRDVVTSIAESAT